MGDKMKKFFAVLLIALFLCGCKNDSVSVQKNESDPQHAAFSKNDFSSGVWLSFSEVNSLLEDPGSFKSRFSEITENLKSLNIENLYIHVRSHCDSIFDSEFFPMTESAAKIDYDIFEYIIDACHKENIKVHAWINPYRVSTSTEDPKELDENSPARRWLCDDDSQNDKNVLIYNGIYLNPGEFDSRQLVINGVKEILDSYDVDGIHFDDYFYPTSDPEFDKESYEAYKDTAKKPLSLDNWRRASVDALISGCKTAIDASGSNAVFSVSPAADIDKNYNDYYADIGSWVKSGYIDEIIPQLYFGFEHTDSYYNFQNLLKEWKELCQSNRSVKLTIGLAAYKIGTQSPSDGSEWQENSDILARQAQICLNDNNVSGIVLFSYSGLFSDQTQNTKERENLTAVLN